MNHKLPTFSLIRKLTALSLLLIGSTLFIANVSAASSLSPSVTNFKVTPLTINYTGGTVTLSANVSNATRCLISVSPSVKGIGYSRTCSSGVVSYRATFPRTVLANNIVYKFKFEAIGKSGEGSFTAPLKTITLVSPAKPVIKSFTSSNAILSNSGGIVSLTGVLANTLTCSVSVSPAIAGFGGAIPCSNQSIITSPALPINSTSTNINYTFTLTATDVNKSVTQTTVVTVDSNPPSTTTTTTPPTPTTTSPTTTTTTPPSTTVGNTVGVPAEPDALLQVGNNIWVASCSGNAVTEINKNSKQIIDELNSSKYNFNCPDALTSDGPNIWVANSLGNSITILNSSTGAFVSNLTGSSIINPIAFATVATNVWVLDSSNQINTTVLSEFNSSGTFLNQVIDKVKGNNWFLINPECITSTGNNFWVSDEEGEQLIEFSGANGHFIRFSEGSPAIGLSHTCVTYSNGYIWASTEGGPEIVEFNASTGVYVKEISNILNTNQLISEGNYLFVVSSPTTDVVKEYNISTSKLIKVIAKSNIGHGNGIRSILYDGDSLWTANYSSSSVSYYNV